MPAPARYHQPAPATPQAPIPQRAPTSQAPIPQYGTPRATPPYGAPQYGMPQAPTPPYDMSVPPTPRREPHPIGMPYYGASFGEAIRRFFVKYLTFSGRASRSEYWWSFLFLAIVTAVLEAIGEAGSDGMTGPDVLADILTGAWGLATFIPGLAVSIRRLHDANKPGWLILLPVILVVITFIIVIVVALAAGVVPADGYTGDTYTGGLGLILVILIVTPALLIAGGIINIVLMCLHTDPRGVRFDRH